MDRATQLAETVAIGKDGWLFQCDETAVEQVTGLRSYSPHACQRWRFALESRWSWLRQRGIRYRFLIVPEKHVVYQDMLPPEIVISELRPAAALVKSLSASHCPVQPIYPQQALIAGRSRMDTYYKLDTHWNSYGAYLCYLELCRSIRVDMPLKVFDSDAITYFEYDHTGDLAVRLDPEPTGQGIAGSLHRPQGQKIYENRSYNRGNVVVFENPDRSLPRAVVFRDSFCSWMLPFFAETFSRLVAVSCTEMYFDLIESEQPDVVITETIERYIHPGWVLEEKAGPPIDITAQPFETYCGVSIPELALKTNYP
jgi:hypothetical protein